MNGDEKPLAWLVKCCQNAVPDIETDAEVVEQNRQSGFIVTPLCTSHLIDQIYAAHDICRNDGDDDMAELLYRAAAMLEVLSAKASHEI